MVANCFGYDRRRITLFGDGDPLAEFDNLFKYKDDLFFVAITLTTKRENIRALIQEIARKRRILTKVLKCQNVYCLIVTSKPNIIHSSDLTDYDVNCIIPFNKELFSLIPEISLKGNYSKPSTNNKFILATDLEYHDISYKKLRQKVKKSFRSIMK